MYPQETWASAILDQGGVFTRASLSLFALNQLYTYQGHKEKTAKHDTVIVNKVHNARYFIYNAAYCWRDGSLWTINRATMATHGPHTFNWSQSSGFHISLSTWGDANEWVECDWIESLQMFGHPGNGSESIVTRPYSSLRIATVHGRRLRYRVSPVFSYGRPLHSALDFSGDAVFSFTAQGSNLQAYRGAFCRLRVHYSNFQHVESASWRFKTHEALLERDACVRARRIIIPNRVLLSKPVQW